MAGLASGASGARQLLLVAVACLAAPTSWATRQVLRGAQDPASGSSLGDLFERVRFAAVRIEAIQASVDFFRPYRPGDDWASTGSGFAVSFNGLREAAKVGSAADLRIENAISFGAEVPTFVTNAHVVRNAHRVNVQMPAIGQEKFLAYVPVICEDFDIALVRLQEPEKFQKALSTLKASVRPFDIHVNNSDLVHMGLGVVSVGFPLGSSTLKIGTGIISGTEQTGTRTRTIICYQSTAPISPGSSGGPLLARDSSGDYQVIGVTYATAASSKAQNTNYVLPSIHIFPVLHEFVQRSVPGSGSGPQMHVQLRFAPSAATLIESSEGIYDSSGGCGASGAFISKISSQSLLAFAEPPVPEKSLLVAVDDIQLDKFGMGRAPGFTGHPIPFGSILTARADLNKSQTVTICQNGKQSTHNVSMWWRPEYDLGVREVLEPYYETELLDYEVFGGVTMMRMTLNHVNRLLNECTQWGTCTMGRWLMERNQIRPRVIVSHVEQGSYAYSVLAEGMTINRVNGHHVTTLEDVRKHFVPEGPVWTLETDRSIMLKVKFEETLAAQLFSAYSAASKRYLLTPAVKEALAGSPVLQAAVGVSSHGNSTGPPDVSTAARVAAAGANSSSGAAPAVARSGRGAVGAL